MFEPRARCNTCGCPLLTDDELDQRRCDDCTDDAIADEHDDDCRCDSCRAVHGRYARAARLCDVQAGAFSMFGREVLGLEGSELEW